MTPDSLFEFVVSTWLQCNEVLAAAEVRMSGGGLHVIIWFDEPVTFDTDAAREKWRQIVRVVQRVIPSDPQQPDLLAMTRPVGAKNSKAGNRVRRIRKGKPISAECVERFAQQVSQEPFEHLTRTLFGDSQITPCPICRGETTTMKSGTSCGHCYACGKVSTKQLFRAALRLPARQDGVAKKLATQFERACRDLTFSTNAVDERLPRLVGVTPRSEFLGPTEAVIANAVELLSKSQRLYRMADDAYIERSSPNGRMRLEQLTVGGSLTPHAHLDVGTVFLCSSDGRDGQPIEFAPPRDFTLMLLRHALRSLREISLYTDRPVYSLDSNYCDAGYDPRAGVLIHGQPIRPQEFEGVPNFETDCIHLTAVLRDFAFRNLADRCNAIAALLTGYLSIHFCQSSKPVVLLDGNQSGVGKTLFAHCTSMILDGHPARIVRFTENDEELAKASNL